MCCTLPYSMSQSSGFLHRGDDVIEGDLGPLGWGMGLGPPERVRTSGGGSDGGQG